jgi:Cellulose biosynthesis protein BcsS
MWNWRKNLRTAVLACIATAGMSTTAPWAGSLKDAPTADTQRGVFFSGYDVVEGARYAFAGMVLALNNDISRDGWALRLYGSRVDFDLDPGEGRGWQGDVMLGYRFVRKHMYGGIYVGADYQNYRLSPDDPTAKVRGTEVGAKVAAELSRLGLRALCLATRSSTPSGWAGSSPSTSNCFRTGLSKSRFPRGINS